MRLEHRIVAVETLVKCGGGMVVVDRSEIMGLLKLPLAGLMSYGNIKDVASDTVHLKKACAKLGSRVSDPFMALSFLALPVIPEFKLTDKGLFEVSMQRFTSLLI
ncbi:MAG: hypothetical protein COV46_08820 [Deltaproteobacteria bacterium CG11_big_fil_rev_8_21_14_0_20_49_13]|nr:MAG: hypothetical protein COV46_08820 [Deltaproteobacteria bacterium CG11_big_fil_rev_8_21_14_0_20_49_13]